jgi:hypothetical protein
VKHAPDGLEALFVERLKATGYSFDAALAHIYSHGMPSQNAQWASPPANPHPTAMSDDIKGGAKW